MYTMAPEFGFREEGNSVDPPRLQTPSLPPPQREGGGGENPASCLHGNNGTCLNNEGTFVFGTSKASSMACVGSSSGVEKMDKDVHTASNSAPETTASLNEPNSATAPPEVLGTGGKEIRISTKDAAFLDSDLQLARQSNDGSLKENGDKTATLNRSNQGASDYFSNDKEYTSTLKDFESLGNNMQKERPSLNESSTAFSIEQAKLAYRLKPQITSDFLSKEIDSTANTKIDVDSILRKYGLETRKYDSPLATSRYAHGDTLSTALTSSATSYKSYSSCTVFSAMNAKNTQAYNHPRESHATVPQFQNLDVSQNNEALGKLIKQESEPVGAKNNKTELASGSLALSQASASEITDLANIDKSKPNQEYCRASHSSTKVDATTCHDWSKNNDVPETETLDKENSTLAAEKLSVAHGSSVDVAVNDRSEGQLGQEKAEQLNHDSPYSGLRGTTSNTAYASPYSGMGMTPGIRTGGYMSSRPSTMDVSPFEGSYLKHHLSMSRYSSSTGVGTGMSNMVAPVQSSAGTSKDSIISNSSSLGIGTPTDSLDYSLQQERYRLRGIDNMISSGAGRISRPFGTVPYIHTPMNPTSTFSYRNSGGSWGKDLPSTASYDKPADIATIRSAGSNVDTGQFNNNRRVPDYVYRANRYGSDMVERLGIQEAWVYESPGRNQNQIIHNDRQPQDHQQQQKQKQVQQKPTNARNASSTGADFIQRNRLAVTQNILAKNNTDPTARDKKIKQRPKPAKTINSANRGSNCTHQGNNSYSGAPNGSEFANEFKRILKESVQGENTVTDKATTARVSTFNKDKSNGTRCGSGSTTNEESIKDKSAQLTYTMKDLPKPQNRQPRACKYQPYHVRTTGIEGQMVHVNPSESGSIDAPSRSSSKVSRSQDSCHDMESMFDQDSKSFPNYSDCHSCQDVSQRSLVAATALASALIHKRQEQLDRLQLFLPGSFCPPREPKKRSTRAGGSNSASTGQRVRSGTKRSPRKTMCLGARSTSARSGPYGNVSAIRKSSRSLRQ